MVFVVADVFWEYQMDAVHIRYFLRKVQTYQQTSNSGLLFPVLMATGFTSDAIREGRKAGLMLTTPQNLFGMHVGRSSRRIAADPASRDNKCHGQRG